MSQQVSKPKAQVEVYRALKYWISPLNSHLSHTLVSRVRNQSSHPQSPNSIIGTISHDQSSTNKYGVPEGVRKVIQAEKLQYFNDVLLNTDVILYDLNSCDLQEVQRVIAILKISQYKQDKILICVSNVMTWAKSKPKIKKQGDQQEQDDNPAEQPDSEEQTQPPADQTQQKKTYVRFTQKDYSLRKPHPAYEKIKSIQTLCLAAGSAKPNLKTYVVCSGIIYGAGQKLLQPYFMQARHQNPASLSVIGKGKNRIPMIHLADLATFIQKVIEKRPALPYLLALDHNGKPTQKKLIQSISKGIGTGKIHHIQYDQNIRDVHLLTLDLRIKPTMYFNKLQEEEAAIQVEQGVQITRFKFTWQAKQGIQKNIQKLRKQFNEAEGLKQQKIFIIGPPGCGKSFYAKKLAARYSLPHLHIKDVIESVKSLKNQLGEQITAAYNQKKQAQISLKQEEYDATKEKWKKLPKQQREPLLPFNPDAVDVRLPDQLVYKCYKWRLQQNDCLNRGYVLDGYPRRYQDAKEIFMSFPILPQGEQPDQNTKKVVDQRLVPTKFILLEKTDQEILQQLQRLPEQKLVGTHFTQSQAKRRLKIYRKLMNQQTGQFIISDFFVQSKIQTHLIQVTTQCQSLLQSIVQPLSISQSQQNAQISSLISLQKQSKLGSRKQMSRKQQIIRNIQSQDYRMKKQNQQNEEREILDKKSLALRKYLDVNLVPILAQGILQILKDFPKDPVDTLAQFLFKNSLKVPNPDPSTFEF